MLGRFLPILLTILSELERSIIEIGAESERSHDGSLKASSRNLLELMGEVGAALQTDIGMGFDDELQRYLLYNSNLRLRTRGHHELQRFTWKEYSSLI